MRISLVLSDLRIAGERLLCFLLIAGRLLFSERAPACSDDVFSMRESGGRANYSLEELTQRTMPRTRSEKRDERPAASLRLCAVLILAEEGDRGSGSAEHAAG